MKAFFDRFPHFAKVALSLGPLAWAEPVRAILPFEDATRSELVTSSRAAGMGNAYIAKVDDASAAFYNPAGLGTVRYPHFHLSNFHVESNRSWMQATRGRADSASNFWKGHNIKKMQSFLRDYRGQFIYSRFQLMPNITARYFSAGMLYSRQTQGLMGSGNQGQFEYSARTDQGPYAAFNLSFMGGIVKLGATAVYLTRREIFGEIPADQTVSTPKSAYSGGRALQYIGGARITLPWKALPTVAAKLGNMTQKEFKQSEGFAAAPAGVHSTLDLGFSLTPQIGQTTRLHLEANYKDQKRRYSGRAGRRFGLGAEIDWRRSFFFRLGYSDGFGSGGIGVRTPQLEFDLTTYAVDRTASRYRGKEDRRLVLSISSRGYALY